MYTSRCRCSIKIACSRIKKIRRSEHTVKVGGQAGRVDKLRRQKEAYADIETAPKQILSR